MPRGDALSACECEACQAERERLPTAWRCLLDLGWPIAGGLTAVLLGVLLGYALGR